MDDINKVVVEPKNPPVAPLAVQPVAEVDSESIIAQKDARIATQQDQIRNLNIALLKAKGKVPNDGSGMTPEQVEEIADAQAKKTIAESELFQTIKEKDDLIKNVLKENKELKVAAQNRSQIAPPTALGGNQPPDVSPPSFFTKEQEDELRKKGLDPEEVKANLLKNKEISQVNI